MKKIVVAILGLLFCLGALSAEHLKVRLDGKSIHYNQIRIVNKTDYPKISCAVYLLEEANGKTYVKEFLGKFNMDGFGDQDTCTFTTNVGKKALIGVELPEDMKEVTYSILYDDGLIIDTIELTLVKGTTPLNDGHIPLGKEF